MIRQSCLTIYSSIRIVSSRLSHREFARVRKEIPRFMQPKESSLAEAANISALDHVNLTDPTDDTAQKEKAGKNVKKKSTKVKVEEDSDTDSDDEKISIKKVEKSVRKVSRKVKEEEDSDTDSDDDKASIKKAEKNIRKKNTTVKVEGDSENDLTDATDDPLIKKTNRIIKKNIPKIKVEEDPADSTDDPVQKSFIKKAETIIKKMNPKVKVVDEDLDIEEDGGSWNWVPPRSSERTDDEVIPVIRGVMLTLEEIKTALESQGAEDVVIVPMKHKMENITHLVVASGRSARHLRKLSDSIVHALKARRLKQAMGSRGAEGGKNDDWLCIDCYDAVVHVMLPVTRKALDLERHWTTDRPVLMFNEDEKIYDRNFERILDLPEMDIPDDYHSGNIVEKVEIGKKQKVTVRRL